jgi:hypothetical protein
MGRLAGEFPLGFVHGIWRSRLRAGLSLQDLFWAHNATYAAVRSSRRSLARFEKRQYLAVVSSAQFRKAVLDKLHHLAPVELVLADGLRDEGETGSVAGLHQLAGAVGLRPDVSGFLNGRV